MNQKPQDTTSEIYFTKTQVDDFALIRKIGKEHESRESRRRISGLITKVTIVSSLIIGGYEGLKDITSSSAQGTPWASALPKK